MSGYDLADIEAKAGPGAAREFEAAADSKKPRLVEWLNNLPGMSDDELYGVAVEAIWDSASVQRFGYGLFEDLHFKASAVMFESRKRRQAASHDEWCSDSIYQAAYNEAVRQAGYPGMARELVCTCDNNNETEDEDK